MHNTLYFKLAAQNLKNNRRTYVPFLLACMGCILMFYNLLSLLNNPGLLSMPGAMSLLSMFSLGVIIIGIFSVVVLFYTNSFLMKQRKKELGLYSILGMEKRHIAKVLAFEMLLTAFISLTLGLLGGVLFGKLIFLALLHLLNIPISLQFVVLPAPAAITALLFICIFVALLLVNFLQIRLTNPISLLHSSHQGEKEPKSSWLLTLTGILSLGGGYAIAVMVDKPIDALSLFFLAVLLVIIGTYALFISGSIALLKLLKRTPWFYYKPKNFVSVSGMIYRMKQNAMGLATICILSTMVLVTLSTTLSLYLGINETLRSAYPKDVQITYQNDTGQKAVVYSAIEKQVADSGISVKQPISFRAFDYWLQRSGTSFTPTGQNTPSGDSYQFSIIPLEDYNTMCGQSYTLASDEILLFSAGEDYGLPVMQLTGRNFSVKEELQTFPLKSKSVAVSFDDYYVIVDSMDTLQQLYDVGHGERDLPPYMKTVFDFTQESPQNLSFYQSLNERIVKTLPSVYMNGIDAVRQDWYLIHGGFLFLGVFLGLLFLMATVLIIYYKQISEGYEDNERFQIMQKVGMSQKEVRQTISKQILLVFFLPLAGAVVHIVFAFGVIRNLLLLFHLSNFMLFLLCTIGSVLFFALIYIIVYVLTARTYYKITQTT